MPTSRKPAQGKAKVKTTKEGKKVSYGEAGAKVAPGTSRGDAYCARSMGIKRELPVDKANDPDTPNNLSRKAWRCVGEKSKRSKK
ncbi:MAG: hypothetical protein EBR73_13550 [Rhodobacteraceae bacterium]|jgi:hypothetical protein|nr:hypothetical protein [Paracoccaceae bacterium]